MYINKFHATNVRILDDIYIDDFNRVNVFAGDNGQGKSSIMDSIIFCLTNTLNGYKMEQLIQRGKKQATIFIDFSLQGHTYEYRIEINKKGGTNRVLIVDGIDDDSYKQSDAVKKLQEAIDPTLAVYGAISVQHKSTDILFETPSNTLQKIKEIFKLQNLKKVCDLIGEDIKENKEKKTTTQSELDVLSSLKFNLLEEVQVNEINEKEYQDQITSLEKEREEYNTKYTQYIQYTSSLKSYNEAQEKIKQLQIERAELETQLQGQSEYNDNLDELYKKEISCNADIVTLQNQIDKIAELNQSLQENEEKAKQHEPKRFRTIDVTDESIDIIRKKIAELNSEIKVIEGKIKLADTGVCWVCGKEYHGNIEELNLELYSCKEEKSKLEIQLKEDNEALTNYKKLVQENEVRLEKCAVYTLEISKLQEQLSEHDSIEIKEEKKKEYEIQLQSLKDEISKQEKRKEEYNKITEANQVISNKIDLIQSKIQDYISIEQPKEIIEEPKKIDEILLDKLKKELSEYEFKKKEQKKIEEHNNKIRQEKERNNTLIKEKQEIVNNLSIENKALKETQKVIDKDFGVYLINKISVLIRNKMNDFFVRSYRGKYETEFQQYAGGVEFYYSSVDDEELHPVSTLSGYEKQAFAMAFKTAISELQDLDIFILDEIDESSSPANSLKLYELLLNENTEQVFCVTHWDSTLEYIENLNDSKVYYIDEGKIIN